jgi:hypothetical protein
MNVSRVAFPIAFVFACNVPVAAEAGSVYQCLNSAGTRTAYVQSASQCPTGTTSAPYRVFDICVIPGACELAPPPSGAQPVEYICCAFVSGDMACVNSNIDDCPPDEYLATCSWGMTDQSGDVTCYD